MAKRQRRIAEVVSTTETTPVNDNITNGKVAEAMSKPLEVTTPVPNSNADWNDSWDKDQTSERERAALAWEKQGIKKGTEYSSQRLFPNGENAIYNYDTGRYEKPSEYDANDNDDAYVLPFLRKPKTEAPGVALSNAIESNKAAETTGNAVLKAGIDNAETAGQVFEAPAIAAEAKKEAEKIQTQLDVNTVNTVNVLSEATSNLSANQTASVPIANVPVAPAALTAVTGGQAGPIRPSYEQVATKADVAKDVASGYKDLATSIPEAVVEKLGVQDYYPEIGRDIAVGTFTGSRIGSQTIYSGAGGLLPMGLYDERKRALVKAAKEKQAKIDKFMEIPDTSEQFNSDYKQGAFSFIQDGMAKHNWDLNAAMKDKEFMKGYYRWQTMGKEITYTDGIVDAIVDSQISKDGKAVPYVPAEVLDQAYKFREGKLDNMDDIMSGKSKIMDYAKNMRNYQNGAEWADGMIPKWSDPAKRVELPMNLKSGKEIDEKALGEIQDSIKKLKENTGSYDSFLNVIKKHYDLDASLVGEWANLNNIPKDDPSIQWLTDYILKQMPADSLIENVERQSNSNFSYWNANFQAKREDKAKETELTKVINNANNLNLKSRLDQISKDTSLDLNQKQVAIKNLYAEAGYNPKIGPNGEIFGVITLGGGGVRKQNVTLNANNAEVLIYNKGTKKNEWVSVGKAMQLKDNTNYFVSDEIKDFNTGQAIIVPNEITMHQTYTGNNGKQYQLKATNLGAYASTNNKEMTTTTYGNIYIAPKETDGPSSKSQLQVRFNSRPETSIQDRSMMDDILGTNQPFATNPEYQGNTGTNYK